jgi:hypothetical protein
MISKSRRSRNARVTYALVLSLAAIGATGLDGQSAPAEVSAVEPPSEPAAFCWRGQALPACRHFALFEMEGALAVASTRAVHESSVVISEHPVFEDRLSWQLGLMRNVSPEWAVGATVSIGAGPHGPATGLRVRARRWLAPRRSVEVEAGAIDTQVNRRFGSGIGWGPTVGGRLNLGDYVSVFARWEAVYAGAGSDGYYSREAGFHQGLLVGASAGSTVAVAGSAALGVAAAFIAYMLSQTDL